MLDAMDEVRCSLFSDDDMRGSMVWSLFTDVVSLFVDNLMHAQQFMAFLFVDCVVFDCDVY